MTPTFLPLCLLDPPQRQYPVLLYNTHIVHTRALHAMPKRNYGKDSERTPQKLHPPDHKCTKCGMNVASGWGHWNHSKVCTSVMSDLLGVCTTPTSVVTTPLVLDAQQSCNDDFCIPDEDDQLQQDPTCGIIPLAAEVSEYLASLPNLDSHHMLECLHWGSSTKNKISAKTREVARFLKVSMLGNGISGEHMQAFLDYTHVMGGNKAVLLPNKVEGCWNELAKVQFIGKCRYTCCDMPCTIQFRTLDRDTCWCVVTPFT
jgi:hypothetical protein